MHIWSNAPILATLGHLKNAQGRACRQLDDDDLVILSIGSARDLGVSTPGGTLADPKLEESLNQASH